MRKCSSCQETKPIEDFAFRNKAKGTRQRLCNPCRREYGKQQYAKHKSKIIASVRKRTQAYRERAAQIKEQYSCVKCGEDDPVVLDFHHTDPSKKDFGVSQIRDRPKAFLEEIKKCVCLCSNCHRKVHAGRFEIV